MRVFVTGGSGFVGTHFIEKVLSAEQHIDGLCNLDIARPKLHGHDRFWLKGDILNASELQSRVIDFNPTHVVHLAARTDMDGKTIQDYRTNTEGTSNLIAALKKAPDVGRAIFTSSQYVVGPGPLISDPQVHRPHTIYGRSKCCMEEIVWNSDLPFVWTLTRPTNIWGSWHPRYPKEIWAVLKKRRYLHPGRKPVYRAYGYVENVVEQMWAILNSPVHVVDRKVLYLGDPVDDIYEWVSTFSVVLTARKPMVAPRFFLRMIALLGDVVRKTGHDFPLFSSRYRSMTQDYRVHMEPTFAALGEPRYSLDEGVRRTVRWLKEQNSDW